MADLVVPDVKALLARRIGEYYVLADLDDATARAARQCGLAPAALTRLVDADLAPLDADDHDKFLDVAELRAWESILGNATDPGLRDAAIDESPSAVREAAREKIKSLSARARDVHGVGLSTLATGTLGLNFQAGGEDDESDY